MADRFGVPLDLMFRAVRLLVHEGPVETAGQPGRGPRLKAGAGIRPRAVRSRKPSDQSCGPGSRTAPIAPGERLPSQRELAQEFDVTPTVISSAQSTDQHRSPADLRKTEAPVIGQSPRAASREFAQPARGLALEPSSRQQAKGQAARLLISSVPRRRRPHRPARVTVL